MAIRTKSVEYAFPQNEATLAAATRFDFAAITLFLPEVTTRTFRSVVVQIAMRQNDAAAASLTSWLIGIKLGAAAFSDVTVTDTLTNSGEHTGWLFTRDVTSYFTTNFGAGASQTCQVGISFGIITSANHTAKLIITYDAEEQQTRVKTVKIPLESFVGALTTTLAEMGVNQVPALDTFLPESTKVFRNIWFEVSGNESNDGTADHSLNLALDAEAADADALHENALASDCWYLRLWVRNAMTTNVVHQFKAAVSAVAGAVHNHLTVVLCVTYEYDHTASTTIINSIQLALTFNQIQGCTVAGDQSLLQKKFNIEEPATIALVQSGVLLCWTSTASVSGFNIACGSQVDRAYTTNLGGVCGQASMIQRIDSGAAGGAGITIARGENTLTVETYNTDTTPDFVSPLTGLLYLNYTSGKHANGDGVHNHTTCWSIMDHAADAVQRDSAAFAPNIVEASYWINSIGFIVRANSQAGQLLAGQNLLAARAAGERGGDGWETLFTPNNQGDSELGVNDWYVDACGIFDRYPNEPQDRLAPETARVYRTIAPTAAVFWHNLLMLLTFHAITFAVSGSITGSAGGTVNIAAYTNAATGNRELIDKTSRVGNGAYSMTWYDNVTNVFAEAREDATHLGRSDDGVAA